LFSPSQQRPNELIGQLGLLNDGKFLVDKTTLRTSNPNIFVAGDLTGVLGPQFLAIAASSGALCARDIAKERMWLSATL
jgi:thioredoxin reductase